jgi:hypothetical protein
VQAAISDAQTLGKHILLKPQVDLYSGEWRAAIQPGSAWFSAYTAFLLPYAKLAESNGVEMFCIGDEFVLATKFEYTAYWKKLIAAIRAVYSGKLIYAANWSSASDYGDNSSEYLQVGFWKNLDYIGIDAYVPVTSGNTIPSLATGITRLSLFGSALQLLSWRVGRQVIFTEIGIPSVQGALAEPWSSSLVTASGAVASNAVQSYYYSAALEAFANRSWCDGFFWWNWNSQTDSYDSLNYTPRNKPAATILKQRYAI